MEKKLYCSDDSLDHDLVTRFTLILRAKKGYLATPPKGGRGLGNIIFFFLEAQFTPLSPDINPISVSQTINF